ncbi:ribbon-helix-helix domain-containing protein [Candidatus Entotheonella palauensis]|uniref:Ribbon-helix-helix protein CopG domain-containing protein n=1 Tax=Candidatus Entotheonella gemina TaxID=1429439 RepID=W4M415_9BACT|nr:ribbon-helix-helix domain-containing protein [Candidatus Entotheonella palauensis]ETX04362.1 MAG: hypothetical protein ETSY2_29230 [Candidatus Entotheonella gemina]
MPVPYQYDPNENMVLRTVYLPKPLDDRLRHMAFETQVSKNEMMRRLLHVGLEHYPEFTTDDVSAGLGKPIG